MVFLFTSAACQHKFPNVYEIFNPFKPDNQIYSIITLCELGKWSLLDWLLHAQGWRSQETVSCDLASSDGHFVPGSLHWEGVPVLPDLHNGENGRRPLYV